MENNSKQPSAKNIFYEYKYKNREIREYHIDTHPIFQTYPVKMSVRCEPTAKQLIILGQDESCFKQFSFSKRCWIGPGGGDETPPQD